MTWKDVKLATLQKMFAAEGSTIPTDESTADYLAGMPFVANEALQRLSTAGKFIEKSIDIAHNPEENLLPDSPLTKVNKVLTFSAVDAFSYYFEFTGKGTVTVQDSTGEKTVELTNKGTYGEYRGLCGGGNVVLIFSCTYPSYVKNVALYCGAYESEDEVPQYAKIIRYNLSDYVDDFYNLAENQVFYEGINEDGYAQTDKYAREGSKTIVLSRKYPGNYRVYYYAYPERITADTPDDYELPVDPDVAVLIPLYMASQLYKDDDNGIATSYRNEFEVGLEALIDNSVSNGKEEFTSESGWI